MSAWLMESSVTVRTRMSSKWYANEDAQDGHYILSARRLGRQPS